MTEEKIMTSGDDAPRKPKPRKPRRKPAKPKQSALSRHGREAVMTLVSIMNDESDPRLQIAAAKALLTRKDTALEEDIQPEAFSELTESDIDAALAIAKKLLDELAARKAAGVSGAGAMAAESPTGADNA